MTPKPWHNWYSPSATKASQNHLGALNNRNNELLQRLKEHNESQQQLIAQHQKQEETILMHQQQQQVQHEQAMLHAQQQAFLAQQQAQQHQAQQQQAAYIQQAVMVQGFKGLQMAKMQGANSYGVIMPEEESSSPSPTDEAPSCGWGSAFPAKTRPTSHRGYYDAKMKEASTEEFQLTKLDHVGS